MSVSSITFTEKPRLETWAMQEVLTIKDTRTIILRDVFTPTSIFAFNSKSKKQQKDENNVNRRIALVCKAFYECFKQCNNRLVIPLSPAQAHGMPLSVSLTNKCITLGRRVFKNQPGMTIYFNQFFIKRTFRIIKAVFNQFVPFAGPISRILNAIFIKSAPFVNRCTALVGRIFNGPHLNIVSVSSFSQSIKFVNENINLKILDLSKTDLSDEDLNKIQTTLKNLKVLCLQKCDHLERPVIKGFRELKFVGLSGTNVTSCTLENLPKLELVTFADPDRAATSKLTKLNLTNLPKLDRIVANFTLIDLAEVNFDEAPALRTIGTTKSQFQILLSGFYNDHGFETTVVPRNAHILSISKKEVGADGTVDTRIILVSAWYCSYNGGDPDISYGMMRGFTDCK